MPTTSDWFLRFGFTIWHTPGVSRAWRYDFAGGNYILVTGLDGFDLPEWGGPYAAMLFSPTDEMVEFQEYLKTTRQFVNWFRRVPRMLAR